MLFSYMFLRHSLDQSLHFYLKTLIKAEVKIVVTEMGTIDFGGAASSGEASIADLSGQVHQVPCCIRFDGPAQVSNYFKPKSSGNRNIFLCNSVFSCYFVWRD